MRAHVWGAALAVALSFALQSTAAPIVVSSGTPAPPAPSFFTPLHLPSFLVSPSKLASFFPSIPSIASPNATASSIPVPMKNGVPTKEYFKQFGLQAAPRAQ